MQNYLNRLLITTFLLATYITKKIEIQGVTVDLKTSQDSSQNSDQILLKLQENEDFYPLCFQEEKNQQIQQIFNEYDFELECSNFRFENCQDNNFVHNLDFNTMSSKLENCNQNLKCIYSDCNQQSNIQRRTLTTPYRYHTRPTNGAQLTDLHFIETYITDYGSPTAGTVNDYRLLTTENMRDDKVEDFYCQNFDLEFHSLDLTAPCPADNLETRFRIGTGCYDQTGSTYSLCASGYDYVLPTEELTPNCVQVKCQYECLNSQKCKTCVQGAFGNECGECEESDGRYLDNVSGSCICDYGWRESGSLCSRCDDRHCRNCSSDDNCTLCTAGNNRVLSSKVCKCENGYVEVLGQSLCVPEDGSGLTCDPSTTPWEQGTVESIPLNTKISDGNSLFDLNFVYVYTDDDRNDVAINDFMPLNHEYFGSDHAEQFFCQQFDLVFYKYEEAACPARSLVLGSSCYVNEIDYKLCESETHRPVLNIGTQTQCAQVQCQYRCREDYHCGQCGLDECNNGICISCEESSKRFLIDGKCVCLAGYFLDGGVCTDCRVKHCQSCSESEQCTACLEGSNRELNEKGDCVCLDGYIEIEGSSNCAAEDGSDLTCDPDATPWDQGEVAEVAFNAKIADGNSLLEMNFVYMFVDYPGSQENSPINEFKLINHKYFGSSDAQKFFCQKFDLNFYAYEETTCPDSEENYVLSSFCFPNEIFYRVCEDGNSRPRLPSVDETQCAKVQCQARCRDDFHCERCGYNDCNQPVCVACNTSSGRELTDGKCPCKVGFYKTNETCTDCKVSGCLECNNQGSCNQCIPGQNRVLKNNSSCSCIDGYYSPGYNLVCLPCHEQCKTCSEENICSTCKNEDTEEPDKVNGGCKCSHGDRDGETGECPKSTADEVAEKLVYIYLIIGGGGFIVTLGSTLGVRWWQIIKERLRQKKLNDKFIDGQEERQKRIEQEEKERQEELERQREQEEAQQQQEDREEQAQEDEVQQGDNQRKQKSKKQSRRSRKSQITEEQSLSNSFDELMENPDAFQQKAMDKIKKTTKNLPANEEDLYEFLHSKLSNRVVQKASEEEIENYDKLKGFLSTLK